MSHAEAFGHFRSFAVGLESNARALRKALGEENRNIDKDANVLRNKKANGQKKQPDGGTTHGISISKCCKALETASAEATTKELIAEVANQETSLNDMEVAMRARPPIDQVMEKYRAIAEYNQLAFLDLEERLSAYGYVPPIGPAAHDGTSSNDKAIKNASQGADSLGDNTPPQEESEAGVQQQNDGRTGGVLSSEAEAHDDEAVAPALGDVEAEGGPSRMRMAEGVEDTEARERVLSENTGRSDGNEREGAETAVRTPTRSLPDELEDDVESPQTPTLADWEISKETREMLRQDQDDASRIIHAAVPKSLEVLLEQGHVPGDDAGVEFTSPASRRGGGYASVLSEGADVACEGVSVIWGSDAPTPRWTPRSSAMSPGGLDGVGGDWGNRDRDSVETPKPLFRSPPKTPMHRSFLEACMSVGNGGTETGTETESSFRGESTTRRDNDTGSLDLDVAEKSPITTPLSSARAMGESLSSVGMSWKRGNVSAVPDGRFVAETVPQDRPQDGSVPRSPCTPEPRRSNNGDGGQLSPGIYEQTNSPDSPRTPPMLTPRQCDSPVSARTRSACAARSAARSAYSSGKPRELDYGNSATPNTERFYGEDETTASVNKDDSNVDYGVSNALSNEHDNDPNDHNNDHDDDDDDDDDDCKTPEMSSPPRTVSVLMTAERLEQATGRNDCSISGALCRRRLEEAGREQGVDVQKKECRDRAEDGPLELVSEEEYSKAPRFLTFQVSRNILNEAIRNLNAYTAPRVETPSALLLTADEIIAIIDQGDLSRTLLLCVAHLERIEMQTKGTRMYRIRSRPR